MGSPPSAKNELTIAPTRAASWNLVSTGAAITVLEATLLTSNLGAASAWSVKVVCWADSFLGAPDVKPGFPMGGVRPSYGPFSVAALASEANS